MTQPSRQQVSMRGEQCVTETLTWAHLACESKWWSLIRAWQHVSTRVVDDFFPDRSLRAQVVRAGSYEV